MDRFRIHSHREAFIEATMPTRTSNILVDVAFPLILTNERLLGDDRPSEECLTSIATRHSIVIAGRQIRAHRTKLALRHFPSLSHSLVDGGVLLRGAIEGRRGRGDGEMGGR